MAALSLTYTITNGTTEDASQVQQNYTDIVNYVNASVMRIDGVNAMTAKLSTDNTDPSAAAHAVRKGYMDGCVVEAQGGANTSLTISTWATILFTTKNRDADNGANTANNYVLGTGVFTAPKTGLYLLTAGVFANMSGTDTNVFNSRWAIRGSQTVNLTGPSVRPADNNSFVDPTAPMVGAWYCVAGDTIQPQAQCITNSIVRQIGSYVTIAWLHG